MRTHSDIIKPSDAEMLAEQLGVSVHTVRSWRQRDSIPGEYWDDLERLKVTTLKELAEAAAAKRGHGAAA